MINISWRLMIIRIHVCQKIHRDMSTDKLCVNMSSYTQRTLELFRESVVQRVWLLLDLYLCYLMAMHSEAVLWVSYRGGDCMGQGGHSPSLARVSPPFESQFAIGTAQYPVHCPPQSLKLTFCRLLIHYLNKGLVNSNSIK